MNHIRPKLVDSFAEKGAQWQADREVAAVELLECGHTDDTLFVVPSISIRLGKTGCHHQHAMTLLSIFLCERLHGTRDASDVRKVGVRHHANIHGTGSRRNSSVSLRFPVI